MIKLNNSYLNWSLAIKESDGLYYDESDINPIPACEVCCLHESCKYSESKNLLEHHRSCFRFSIKSRKLDRVNIYVNGNYYSWSDFINKFNRGIKK